MGRCEDGKTHGAGRGSERKQEAQGAKLGSESSWRGQGVHGAERGSEGSGHGAGRRQKGHDMQELNKRLDALEYSVSEFNLLCAFKFRKGARQVDEEIIERYKQILVQVGEINEYRGTYPEVLHSLQRILDSKANGVFRELVDKTAKFGNWQPTTLQCTASQAKLYKSRKA